MKIKITVAAMIVAAAAFAGYWYSHLGAKLTVSDSVFLADFTNSTGDSRFDGSLREALGISLRQSPMLNVVSDEKADAAVRSLRGSGDDPPMRGLEPQVCQGVGATGYISGSISKDENEYRIELNAFRCAGGRAIAASEAKTSDRKVVLAVLGNATARLRRELGEPDDSIRKFDLTVLRAASPSLEALKAYSQGRKLAREKGALEAIPVLKKATELDPRFALAYSNLAVNYYNMNQTDLAGEAIRQAFECGDRQTVRDRLHITTLYYDLGTGDVQKAIESYKEWTRTYPRDDIAQGNLSAEYFVIGQYEQAAQAAQEALRLDPESAAWYENLSTADIALLRLNEADAVLREAFARKLDDASFHANLYELAFLRGDAAGMQRELAWAAGKTDGEDTLLAMQADTEAYAGHLKKAREFSQRAVEAAQRAQLTVPAAIWQGTAALREAAFGNAAEARKAAEKTLQISPQGRDPRMLAALALARIGDEARTRALADDLRALYVSNTVVQLAWLPTVRAQSEMAHRDFAKAIEFLEAVRPYERGQLIGNLSNSCMYAAYLRGEAYLNAQKGPQAQAEFRKILDNRGVVGNCWSGALAHAGLARAQAMSGNASAARTTYQQFFALWKEADPDIPVLKQAKAEYAKLK